METNDAQRLKELLRQWHDHELPPQLQEELFHLLERTDLNESLESEMQTLWEGTKETEVFDALQKERMLASIVKKQQSKRISIPYMVAAAAVLLVISTVAFMLWHQPEKTKIALVNQTHEPVKLTDITAPAINKAVLTLANGDRIVIENSGEGKLADEGNISVVKQTDGQLVYKGITTDVKWNTLTVPKGSKPMRLILADGSAITLNVASSITYPTAFSGYERHVTMTGEAYFEIAKMPAENGDGKKPFIVSVNGMAVEVTGTKFNVNGYEDEALTKTTLLEGSVNIVAGNMRQNLIPGEQAAVGKANSNEIKINPKADLPETMAWLNGKFRFNNADVEMVMRQVARWYDVKVTFAAHPNMRFGGQIDRSSTLRQMLTILEKSGLHFTLEEKVLNILP